MKEPCQEHTNGNGMTNSRHPTTPQNAKNRQPQKQLPALLFSGLAEIRTPVRTRKPYVFYMLISAFGFRATARPEPPTVTLSSKLHPCTEAYTGYFRFYLHRLTLRFGTTSLEQCLVPSSDDGIKLIIYYTSIKQRERSYFRQLIL